MTVWTSRPAELPADQPTILALITAAETRDRVDIMAEAPSVISAITNPDLDPQNLQLWFDAAGRPVAVTMLSHKTVDDRVDSRLWLRRLPEIGDPSLERAMVDWGIERTRRFQQTLRRCLYIVVNIDDAERLAGLNAAGFTAVREFVRMDITLDRAFDVPQLPPGYVLRTTGHDDDRDAWADLFNDSFVDHWNFQPMTAKQLAHYWTDPDYKPALDFIVVAPDGTFAAFCTAEFFAGPGGRGWIDMVATRRSERGRGLARTLVFAGLNALRDHGAGSACLIVDSDSPTGAHEIYRGFGFTPGGSTYRMLRVID